MGNKPSLDKSKIIPTLQTLETEEKKSVVSGSIIGGRANQEDTSIITSLNLKDHYLYAVFDGHGGGATSKWLAGNFVKELQQSSGWRYYSCLPKEEHDNFDFKRFLTDLFLIIDLKIKLNQIFSYSGLGSGSTAVVVLQTPTKYISINVGDSEAWILRENDIVKLSTNHKPDDPIERERIYKAGGFVNNGRINNNINMSRAFGDFAFKKAYNYRTTMIIAVPSVNIFDRNQVEGRLLLGSDGFFDIMDVTDKIRGSIYIQNKIKQFRELRDDIVRVNFKMVDLAKKAKYMRTENVTEVKMDKVKYIIPSEEDDNLTSDNQLSQIIKGYIPIIDSNIQVKQIIDEIDWLKYDVEMLLRLAVSEGSMDNVTLILVSS